MEKEVALLEVLFVDESITTFETKPDSISVDNGFISFIEIVGETEMVKAFNERIIKMFSVKVKE